MIASEVWTLTVEERLKIAEETVEIVAGRIPVVIGVSTGSIHSSLPLTYHAAEIGANAIIATPPVGPASTLPAIYDFYTKLSDATSIADLRPAYRRPIWNQNAGRVHQQNGA